MGGVLQIILFSKQNRRQELELRRKDSNQWLANETLRFDDEQSHRDGIYQNKWIKNCICIYLFRLLHVTVIDNLEDLRLQVFESLYTIVQSELSKLMFPNNQFTSSQNLLGCWSA